MSLTDKFEKMGARAKVERLVPSRRSAFNVGSVRLDVRKDKLGTFFDIQAGDGVSLEVLDVKAKERHLLLMARTNDGNSKFLCGHDERDWFVAAIPETSSASSVKTAMEALKPKEVIAAQDKKGLKSKDKNRRRNKAWKRQGEWFFIPCTDLKVDEKLILPNEPLRRGRSKPHMAEFLYRVGGETVWVNSSHPNGLTKKEYESLSADSRKRGMFRVMQRDPKVYVKGKIRHSDHKTIELQDWHEVQLNTESQSRAMRNVAFLD